MLMSLAVPSYSSSSFSSSQGLWQLLYFIPTIDRGYGHADFVGDVPAGIKYLHLLATRFKETGNKGQIIGIFHGAAAYLTLNDRAYGAYRLVDTGNPYKNLLTLLIEQGVQIEECAISMKNNGWGNQDLLPGVKVNGGAVGRLIQLVQEGYIQIQP